MGLHGRLLDWEQDFDPPIQVARHQIGAAHVKRRIAIVVEVVDARMLQEAADDTHHLDIIADSGDARTQAANTANDQIDLHARLGRHIEMADDLAIHQRIAFEDEPPLRPQLGFAPDHLQQSGANGDRRDQELAIRFLAGVSGQKVEQIAGIIGHLFIIGHEADIGVDSSRDIVVIPAGQMNIALDAIPFTPNDQRHLAMSLQADQPVGHMDAHPLQLLRPLDVGFLIKASLQFNDGRHLLVVQSGLLESLQHRRVIADTIEGRLDSQHVGIIGRLFQQIDDRGKAVIRVMEQEIALTDNAEDAAAQVLQRWRRARGKRFILQIRPLQFVQFRQATEAKGAVGGVDVVGIDPQV